MTHGKRVARNTVIQAAAFSAQGLTEFLVALALARLAGAEVLGEFTTFVILAGLFAFISAFGLPGLLTRELARLRDDRPQFTSLVNASVGLVIVLSIIAFVLMVGLGFLSHYSPMFEVALALTALALAVESVTLVVAAAFRGVEALEQSSLVIAVTEISFLVLAVAAVLIDTRVDLLMAAYLTSRLLALMVVLHCYHRFFGRLRPAIDRAQWRALLRTGFPFSVNSIFSFAYSRADIVALSYLAGYVAVGLYEVAYGLTMRLNIVARAVTLSLYPLLALQFNRDRRQMQSYTANGIRFLTIPSFLIAIILWMFGPDVLLLLYGPEFAEAAGLAVRVLALAVPLRFLETSLGVALDASNRAGNRATAVAIAAVTNLLINIVLIPTYGMMGAVYATFATEIVISILFLWFLRAEIRQIIDWRGFVAPALGIGAVLISLQLFGGANTWILMALSVAVYAVTVAACDLSGVRSLRQLATRGHA